MFPVRKNATAKQVSRCPRVHVSLEQLPLKGGEVLLGGSLCKFTFNSRSRLAPDTCGPRPVTAEASRVPDPSRL